MFHTPVDFHNFSLFQPSQLVIKLKDGNVWQKQELESTYIEVNIQAHVLDLDVW